ncbi:hypothetical protein N5C46_02960 [Rossellomorea vietnamensis]|uniref:Uncharacterized protein n=1 Tax=Rossellomorea vietnamensis TaxID=218284 RepID=A0ACD4C8N8_9BACI|nr:hypothetical protein [Rossellomorea vietnamensis]UXH45044.1 hypothetical protein N5C46_02960 [Rossellomorea vietnamensis]
MNAFIGEVVGTALLIVFGAGVCANVNLKKSFAYNAGWIVITFGWGYSWVPVVGPVLGGSFGGVFYKAVFIGQVTTSFWVVLVILLAVLGLAYASDRKTSLAKKVHQLSTEN